MRTFAARCACLALLGAGLGFWIGASQAEDPVKPDPAKTVPAKPDAANTDDEYFELMQVFVVSLGGFGLGRFPLRRLGIHRIFGMGRPDPKSEASPEQRQAGTTCRKSPHGHSFIR